MALVVKDRVKETTATTGTGTLTLAGAVTGFQTFTSVLSDGDTTYYGIFESATGAFEVGLGTFTSSGTTLARTTILESSNSGSAVNIGVGSKDVFITQPAEKAVYLDASGYIAAADGRNVTNVDASTAATLATARNIGGVSFDGSANIDLAGVNTAGNQDTSGNAATATALETGRTISLTGDVTGTSGSFDGSGNASIAATIAANSVALGTDTTGNYVGSGATSGNGISGSVSSEGGTFTVTSNATNLNTGSTTVFRDASGNFSAGTITAALSGNATTATSAAALTTARNIAVSGAVTGNANFDGSGNITISTTATSDPTITLGGDLSGSATLTNLGSATLTATINANSVALGTDTTGSYVQQGATSGNGISGSVNSEAGTFTVTSNATNANTGNTIVYRDASGNFSAGTITGTLSGNATNIS